MSVSYSVGDADYPTTITVLGAGCEVGRSCVFAERGNDCVMFDCGLHPALSGVGALPVFEAVDITKVKVCLVTHFHLDHCGAIPYLLSKTGFKGKILMTCATKAICHLLWTDYARMEQLCSVKKIFDHTDKLNPDGTSNEEDEDVVDELVCGSGLYSFEDVEYALNHIETIDFHEERSFDGIKISCYRAGHVLGACMFLVEMDGVRILYTGDYSTEYDRHLPSAEIPNINVHLLISESTYGIRIHEERTQREARFLHVVLDILMRDGKCLLPVFALGRAQEILLILEEYWAANKQLQSIPIFYISPLASKSLRVYETFIGLCGEYVKESVYNGHNPFNFKFVKYAKSVESIRTYLLRDGPCVVMTSPGMLQGGPSLEVFEIFAPDNRNGVILTGYTVKGTLADALKKDPEVLNLGSRVIKRRCTIEQISFSAHTDYNQTKDFIRRLCVPNVILVHGERSEMKRMRDKLSEEMPELSIFMPEVLQVVSLNFSQNRFVNTVGKLASDLRNLSTSGYSKETGVSSSDLVSSVVVYDNYVPKMMYSSDVESYGNMDVSFLTQRMKINFPFKLDDLKSALLSIYDDVKSVSKSEIDVCNLVRVSHVDENIILEWTASPVADLIADSINVLAIEIISDRKGTLEELEVVKSMNDASISNKVIEMQLIQKFGNPVQVKAESKKSGKKLHFSVSDPQDENSVIDLVVDFKGMEVTCGNDEYRNIAMKIIQSVKDSLQPITI
ncbi:cleavage and polyadenylation specificity factor protein, putative [Theileria equi strain WA]|uniref:Cleavage and polyadenylation specificity factor protein, putative n=1 Tax=Theileria equi strain WA TaxID=1537102 RepID=L1LB66_THEEQ|nr:cleavage and polyadenylation specificity factor protein, putative [Theileria equi strain WA]EKX72682.1 cleavage and polyadenylation specificity factor protein, putative [Theileria equi strain WA]|eukprot:XP_004832134.1 cleavage and polyadenylation specificity factor protein, putative [Theileria equi strain WA]